MLAVSIRHYLTTVNKNDLIEWHFCLMIMTEGMQTHLRQQIFYKPDEISQVNDNGYSFVKPMLHISMNFPSLCNQRNNPCFYILI